MQLCFCFSSASPNPLRLLTRSKSYFLPLPIMRKRRSVKPAAARRSTKRLPISRSLIPPKSLLISVSALLALALVAYNFTPISSLIRPSDPPNTPSSAASLSTAPVFKAEILHEYEHDRFAFTQGLVFHDGFLYESTGLRGKSSLRKVDIATGDVLNIHNLSKEDFGEGLTVIDNGKRIVQVLWKVGRGYVYDTHTFEKLFEFSYRGDGWGLAARSNSNRMFLSDGSSTIKIFELADEKFNEISSFVVKDGNKEVGLLNELELVGDELWANIWLSDFVARINPDTGVVIGWVDLRELLSETHIPKNHQVDVLNGIAYDPLTDAIYVTGKHWPKLFSINLTQNRVADHIRDVTDPFFLNPDRVQYIHTTMFR